MVVVVVFCAVKKESRRRRERVSGNLGMAGGVEAGESEVPSVWFGVNGEADFVRKSGNGRKGRRERWNWELGWGEERERRKKGRHNYE